MPAGNKKVRVRGGPKGFRWITLEDWKREINERRGKLPKSPSSPRSRKQETKRKRKNKRKPK